MLFVPDFPLLFTLHALFKHSNTLWLWDPAMLLSHMEQTKETILAYHNSRVYRIFAWHFYLYYKQDCMQSNINLYSGKPYEHLSQNYEVPHLGTSILECGWNASVYPDPPCSFPLSSYGKALTGFSYHVKSQTCALLLFPLPIGWQLS